MDRPTVDELRMWTAALTRDPLDPADPSETRYVELRESGRGAARRLLRTVATSAETTSQLLTGPSGSGKTTELNRLRGELTEAGYRVALVDVAKYLSLTAPVSITEFLLAIGLGAHSALTPQDPGGAGFVTRLREFLGRMKITLRLPGFEATASADGMHVETLGVGVETSLAQAMRSDRPVVDELRARLGFNTADLHAMVARHLAEAFAKTPAQHGSVLIVDSLEQIAGVGLESSAGDDPNGTSDASVQESVRTLFGGSAGLLRFSSCHTIYTAPTYLQLIDSGALAYDTRVPVPVPHVRPRPGAAGDSAAATVAELREAVSRRVPVERIFAAPGQLDRIIESSGGHLRDLFAIVTIVVRAVYGNAHPLPVADLVVDQAISEYGQPFRQMTSETAGFLRKVAGGDGRVQPDSGEVALMARLLRTHMLLGHLNGDDWYEVHPLARPALNPP